MSKSKDRPDLLVLNAPAAFVPEGDAFNSVILVEFKRPGREKYKEKQATEDPVAQAKKYIQEIRVSGFKTEDGLHVPVKEGTPFFVYIICDITDSMKPILASEDFDERADGLGYYRFHKQFKAYIEVISYFGLVEDAKKRNQALFRKLDETQHVSLNPPKR